MIRFEGGSRLAKFKEEPSRVRSEEGPRMVGYEEMLRIAKFELVA